MTEQVQPVEENVDSEQQSIRMVALVVWFIGVVAGLQVMLQAIMAP